MRNSPRKQEIHFDYNQSLFHQSLQDNTLLGTEKLSYQPFNKSCERKQTSTLHNNNTNNNNFYYQNQPSTPFHNRDLQKAMPESGIERKWNHNNHLSSDDIFLQHGLPQKENTPSTRFTMQGNFAHDPSRVNEIQSPNQQINGMSRSSFDTNDLTNMDDESFEEIDEDNSSDFEEEEEMMRQIYCNNIPHNRSSQHHHHQQQVQVDATSTLLSFAENVTNELQKYLHKNKEQEDSCDIYEDKWATTKSGRELYYADLLRIAQGEPDTSSASSSSNKNNKKSSFSKSSCNTNTTLSDVSPSTVTTPQEDTVVTDNTRGFREASIGLGPLEELFEYGLKNSFSGISGNITSQTSLPQPSNGNVRRGKGYYEYDATSSVLNQHHSDIQAQSVGGDGTSSVPMHKRVLPESFWKEPSPSSNVNSGNARDDRNIALFSNNSVDDKYDISNNNFQQQQQQQMLQQQQRGLYLVTQKLPDFTDLMESWHGGSEK